MDQSKEVLKAQGLEDTLVLDCQGTKIVTNSRVLAKGKDYPGSDHFVLSRIVDPDCSEYLKPDIDGVESRLEAASEMRATHRDAINYLISRKDQVFFACYK